MGEVPSAALVIKAMPNEFITTPPANAAQRRAKLRPPPGMAVLKVPTFLFARIFTSSIREIWQRQKSKKQCRALFFRRK